ncbi:MAG: 4-hydroxy-tetrahydrodipicolinate reductase [Candidatus Omnitrophica bacterium]|nr:4-hydroxy-tetrahydrodipicolinate reductase [Candidatus Omnitrophota bacterium]
MNPKIRLIVTGCCGRMGSLIAEEALKRGDRFVLAAAIEHDSHPMIGRPHPTAPFLKISTDLKTALGQADLLVEFTTPEATLSNAALAASAKIPMVIGTTGFSAGQMETLKKHSVHTPIFWSPNMSIGIVIIRRAIHHVSEQLFKFGLGAQTHVQISETHHTRKKDKPSGTAKALAEELLKATGWLVKDEEIESVREGEVVGIHSVTFNTGPELITLRHEAVDRRLFAQGALLVAGNFHKILNGNKTGWYSMDDFTNAMQNQRVP